MSQSKPVTELVVLQLKQGVSLDDVYSGQDCPIGSPGHYLVQLGDTLKAQKGCVRQFWGPQIENPMLFVWSIDWETFEHHAAFINSEKYNGFMTTVAQVFDLEAAAPLMMHTAFTSDASAAREAPVTELAWFMLSKDTGEGKKTDLEDAAIPLFKSAVADGKCSAFAVGWVFEDQPHAQATNGQAIALHGLLGWPAVDDHMAYREQPEFTEYIGPINKLILPRVQGRSMFHAKFNAVK